jgi:hypothetical protein
MLGEDVQSVVGPQRCGGMSAVWRKLTRHPHPIRWSTCGLSTDGHVRRSIEMSCRCVWCRASAASRKMAPGRKSPFYDGVKAKRRPPPTRLFKNFSGTAAELEGSIGGPVRAASFPFSAPSRKTGMSRTASPRRASQMEIFQPTVPSKTMLQPPCPKCATPMWIARIEPHGPGVERRTFECASCDHSEIEIVNFA